MPATAPAVLDIIERYRAEPAPFLPILHAIQESAGWLSRPALELVSQHLEIPLSELYGTVTFYHYFRTTPDEPALRRCSGPACRMRGAGTHGISCPGRCDTPVATSAFEPRECAMPPASGFPEVLFANMRAGKRTDYSSLSLAPEEILERVKKSGLAGRGGAGFPTGVKWEAVRNAPGFEKYVVCNADEGEPGCFKDRVLLDRDPHAVLEGMAAAARVTGARTGIIYLRYEYPDSIEPLRRAIGEAPLDKFRVFIRRGAGAYICGEETSLLNSLEGARPFPREKPPYPTTHGLFQKPTVINNVETFAAVGPVLRGGRADTKIFSVSGDVARPGNYEIPLGTPLRTLLELAGARDTKAVTMAGISGGFLGGEDLDVKLDIPSVKAAGSMLGAAGIIVYDKTRCMICAAEDCMRFFADESCGKCFPCRIGTTRLAEMIPQGRADEIREIGEVMAAASACGLGLAAPLVTTSLAKYWPNEMKVHAAH